MVAQMFCQHLSVFWDIDEYVCRNCSRSLTFPARSPGEGDAASVKSENLAVAGIARMRERTTKDTPDTPDIRVSCIRCRHSLNALALVCVGCNEAVVALARDGNYRLPPHVAPRLLPCKCCGWELPQFCFYRSPRSPRREYRFARCKVCCSQRVRTRREETPEPFRARGLVYSRQVQKERVDGQRPSVRSTLTAQQKESGRLANQRLRARRNGRDVPKLRSGAQGVYVKIHECRAVQCPLRMLRETA